MIKWLSEDELLEEKVFKLPRKEAIEEMMKHYRLELTSRSYQLSEKSIYVIENNVPCFKTSTGEFIWLKKPMVRDEEIILVDREMSEILKEVSVKVERWFLCEGCYRTLAISSRESEVMVCLDDSEELVVLASRKERRKLERYLFGKIDVKNEDYMLSLSEYVKKYFEEGKSYFKGGYCLNYEWLKEKIKMRQVCSVREERYVEIKDLLNCNEDRGCWNIVRRIKNGNPNEYAFKEIEKIEDIEEIIPVAFDDERKPMIFKSLTNDVYYCWDATDDETTCLSHVVKKFEVNEDRVDLNQLKKEAMVHQVAKKYSLKIKIAPYYVSITDGDDSFILGESPCYETKKGDVVWFKEIVNEDSRIRFVERDFSDVLEEVRSVVA